jgi:hypothetical protein
MTFLAAHFYCKCAGLCGYGRGLRNRDQARKSTARDLKKLQGVKLETHFLGIYEHGTCAYKDIKTCKEQVEKGGFGGVKR